MGPARRDALLLALTAFGWRDRTRLLPAGVLARRRRVELLVFAGVVVAVAFLTQLLTGLNPPQARAAAPAQDQLPLPPPPPVGAIVLAQEAGRRAVAIAVRPAAYRRPSWRRAVAARTGFTSR
ncbi:MAG: hypothetical protein ABR569_08335 [Gaiellaceae bacterium]